MGADFDENYPTLVDVYHRMEIDNKTCSALKIRDTDGNEEYSSLRTLMLSKKSVKACCQIGGPRKAGI